MFENKKIKKFIIKCAYVVVIISIIAIISMIIFKYYIEGETNMPFKLSSIIMLSSAEGYGKESSEYIWNTEIYQYNDVYINLEKNKNYKQTEYIKSVQIENIQIENAPKVGNIEVYRATSNIGTNLFNYSEEYKINNNIEYLPDIQTDLANLKISNQGGTIIIRILNKTNVKYTSNDAEFEHNGKLLNKVGISYEDIKAIITFDLIINTESDISFKTTVKLEVPVNDITKEGISNNETTNTKNIVFKRR